MGVAQDPDVPFVAHRHVQAGHGWQGTFTHHLFSLTMKGGATYRLPDGETVIHAGDLLSFTPLAWQDWQADAAHGWMVTWTVLDLPAEVRDCMPEANLAPGIGRVHLDGEAFREAKRAFACMLAWNGKLSAIRERMIVNQLSYVLLLCHDRQPHARMDMRIMQAREFLRERIETVTTLADVCEATHLSRARLCALFKAEAGGSPLQYLESLRMEEACRRLRFTADTIDAIAAALAYADRKYFDKRFKRHMGVTPYAYRCAAWKTSVVHADALQFAHGVPDISPQDA